MDLKIGKKTEEAIKLLDMSEDQEKGLRTAIISDSEELMKGSEKELSDKAKESMKDYLSPEDHKKKVEAEAKTLAEKMIKEKEEHDQAIAERTKKVEEAKVELTEFREKVLKGFELNEEGNKNFDAWLEDLKSDRIEKKADSATPSKKDKPGAPSLKNTTPSSEADKDKPILTI